MVLLCRGIGYKKLSGENTMTDAWILVWSQIGSVVLWVFCVLAVSDTIAGVKGGWNQPGETAFLFVISILCGWGAWVLWP